MGRTILTSELTSADPPGAVWLWARGGFRYGGPKDRQTPMGGTAPRLMAPASCGPPACYAIARVYPSTRHKNISFADENCRNSYKSSGRSAH
jgi:hypothetical protein